MEKDISLSQSCIIPSKKENRGVEGMCLSLSKPNRNQKQTGSKTQQRWNWNMELGRGMPMGVKAPLHNGCAEVWCFVLLRTWLWGARTPNTPQLGPAVWRGIWALDWGQGSSPIIGGGRGGRGVIASWVTPSPAGPKPSGAVCHLLRPERVGQCQLERGRRLLSFLNFVYF